MRKIFSLLVVLAMVIFLIPAGASALMLAFEPVSQEVPVGASADVALTLSGLGDGIAPSLSTFDLDILFNPAILTFDSVTFGDPILGDQLDVFGLGLNPTFAGLMSPGVLNVFELSLDLQSDLDFFQADSFTLATLTFDTLVIGTSFLNISINALGDALGDPLYADVTNGSISAVPEPSTLLLLGSGLLGIPWFRKKWGKV